MATGGHRRVGVPHEATLPLTTGSKERTTGVPCHAVVSPEREEREALAEHGCATALNATRARMGGRGKEKREERKLLLIDKWVH